MLYYVTRGVLFYDFFFFFFLQILGGDSFLSFGSNAMK